MLKNFPRKIQNLLLPRSWGSAGVMLVLVFCGFSLGDLALAEDGNGALKGLASILSSLVGLISGLSLLLVALFGDLLGNRYITGPDAMETLQPMWLFARNVTNLFFVVLLLYLVFANLFSFGSGNWNLKEKLPRIILAMIAINFSLLVGRVILDGVNAVTTIIISFPSELQGEEEGGYQKYMTELVCPEGEPALKKDKNWEDDNLTESDYLCLERDKDGEIYVQEVSGKYREINNPNPVLASLPDAIRMKQVKTEPADGTEGEPITPQYTWNYYNSLLGCKEPKEGQEQDCLFSFADPTGSGFEDMADGEMAHNLFLNFAIQILDIKSLPILSARLKEGGNFFKIIDYSIFSALMAIVYAVALLAVFIAMIIRIAAVWLLLVASPIIMAALILDLGGKIGDLASQAVNYIIMPIKVAAAFAVSFVMVSNMIDVPSGVGTQLINFDRNVLSSGGDPVSTLMWQILTVIIFWKIAFWAFEGTIAEGITNSIKGAAEKLGSFAVKAGVMDQPLVQMVGKGDASLTTLLRAPEALSQARTRKMTDEYNRTYNLTGDAAKANNLEAELEGVTTGAELIRKTAEYDAELLRHNRNAFYKYAKVVGITDGQRANVYNAITRAKDGNEVKQILRSNAHNDFKLTVEKSFAATGKSDSTPEVAGQTAKISISENGNKTVDFNFGIYHQNTGSRQDIRNNVQSSVGAFIQAGLNEAEIAKLGVEVKSNGEFTDSNTEAFFTSLRTQMNGLGIPDNTLREIVKGIIAQVQADNPDTSDSSTAGS